MLIESFWNQVHLTKIFCVSDTVNLGRKTTHKTKLYRVEPSISIASCSEESNSTAEMHCKEGSVSRGEGRNMPEEVK